MFCPSPLRLSKAVRDTFCYKKLQTNNLSYIFCWVYSFWEFLSKSITKAFKDIANFLNIYEVKKKGGEFSWA